MDAAAARRDEAERGSAGPNDAACAALPLSDATQHTLHLGSNEAFVIRAENSGQPAVERAELLLNSSTETDSATTSGRLSPAGAASAALQPAPAAVDSTYSFNGSVSEAVAHLPAAEGSATGPSLPPMQFEGAPPQAAARLASGSEPGTGSAALSSSSDASAAPQTALQPAVGTQQAVLPKAPSADAEPPSELCCPICYELLRDAVVIETGAKTPLPFCIDCGPCMQRIRTAPCSLQRLKQGALVIAMHANGHNVIDLSEYHRSLCTVHCKAAIQRCHDGMHRRVRQKPE